MSEWPAFEKEDDPNRLESSEQEMSWLLPQSQVSPACELAASREDEASTTTVRLIAWVRSVSAFHRHQ
ncbi:hypothetical protein ACIPL1_17040 [Pseudomonas sp. NPDC090202]|uniref:hypothetical protein n=1 Tax=unclassified Pseudomonas TaxID=196821 RepID=UPI00381CA835